MYRGWPRVVLLFQRGIPTLSLSLPPAPLSFFFPPRHQVTTRRRIANRFASIWLLSRPASRHAARAICGNNLVHVNSRIVTHSHDNNISILRWKKGKTRKSESSKSSWKAITTIIILGGGSIVSRPGDRSVGSESSRTSFEASCTFSTVASNASSPRRYLSHSRYYHCLSSSFSLCRIARPISLFSRFVSSRSLNAPSTSPPCHSHDAFIFIGDKRSWRRPDL